MKRIHLNQLAALMAFSLSLPAMAALPYYRSPAIEGNQLVFTAEGDLWVSTLEAGIASRLTTHPAEENQALFSPDGQQVLYVAAYDGSMDIYQLSRSGGQPKRLTALNGKVKLHGFSPDGELLYSTDANTGPVNTWQLRLLNLASGQSRTLPLQDAVEGVIDPQGQYLYFIRYGLQLTGDNARQYQGGARGQLWRWKLNSTEEAQRLLAEHQGSLRNPVWRQGELVLISDASGMPNLWRYQPATGQFSALTQHQDYAVRSVRASADQLIYQQGADMHLLDSSGHDKLISPALLSDSPAQRERLLSEPLKYLTDQAVSFKAEKLVLTVRGKVEVLSRAPKRTVELPLPETARARSAVLSPNGQWVYLLSDQSGELQIWRYAADGSDQGKQMTDGKAGFRWQLSLSPDGRYLAHDDKAGRLFILDTQNGNNHEVYQQGFGLSPYTALVWQPDSSALAFVTETDGIGRAQLGLYSLREKKTRLLTSADYNSYSPAFSPDNQWLYFLSERQLQAKPGAPWGDRNMGPAFDKRALVFAYALSTEPQFPFDAGSELTKALEGDPKPLALSQLGQNLWQVPVVAGNYQKLQVAEKHLYLLSAADAPGQAGAVHSLSIEPDNKALKGYASSVRDIQVAADGKNVALWYQMGPASHRFFLGAATAKAPDGETAEPWASDKLVLKLKPKAEWQQMYQDAWLMHREFLFDPAMRGKDWTAMKQHYLPLLDRVRDRFELDDVLAQLIGELSVLHSQVRGGDYAKAQEQSQAASLGGQWRETDKGLVLQTLYLTDADLPWLQSPLAKGIDPLHNGDLLLAVNHQQVRTQVELQQQLLQQQGQQVLLSLQRDGKNWQKVVVPQSPEQEQTWRYQHWVNQNKALVAKQSQGRFGYLHLYAMGSNDLAQFARDFYAQMDKEGLVIDVRRNRGGNIDSWVIEKLLRRVWAFWQPQQGKAYTNMQQTFRGRLVVLTDPLTYSDGETFAAGVKALGLGPVIGQQTSGAGVWLSGRNLLTDFGVARVAETAQFDAAGRWIIEGRGVSPDIHVENLPFASFAGQDAQLSRAIQELNTQLEQAPVPALNAEPLHPGMAADAQRLR
ncbi:S41 family peptidase [Rheinheimera marina]|uniref:Tricorn protease homolog n=1 Tax=Rheinheimera marina TaxID=1774958 RepID=A0ABV9JNU7_9GAMM